MTTTTLQDIARHCGVSVQTVSSILNARGHLYRKETRQKVLDTARRLGYRPNILARGLRGGKTQAVGLVLPDLNSSAINSAKLRTIEKAARQHGYRLLVGVYEDDPVQLEQHVSDFLGLSVDGLILWTNDSERARVIDLATRARKPLVVIEPDQVGDDAPPSVNVDRELGGYLQARHLIDTGRTRIASLLTSFKHYKSIAKIRGIERAMAEAGRELDPKLCIRQHSCEGQAPEVGVRMARHLLESGQKFDSILTLSDSIALGVMAELVRHGLKIPHDVAVIGYDDDPFAKYTLVPLTTIHQPRDIGTAALDMLLKQMRGLDEDEPPARNDAWQRHVSLAPTLIVRESTVAGAGTGADTQAESSQFPEISLSDTSSGGN